MTIDDKAIALSVLSAQTRLAIALLFEIEFYPTAIAPHHKKNNASLHTV
jgi:hypothetical protein